VTVQYSADVIRHVCPAGREISSHDECCALRLTRGTQREIS
jgi:hypothetical protein